MALHSTGNHNSLTAPDGNPINFVINPGNLDNPTNPGYHPQTPAVHLQPGLKACLSADRDVHDYLV